MSQLNIEIENAKSFIGDKFLPSFREELSNYHRMLVDKTGKGNDFLGWIDLPVATDADLINRINEDASWIQAVAEVFVVIGIGGSYLGSRAVIEALGNPFQSLLNRRVHPLIIFAGENLSEDYHANLLELLDHKNYAVAVISKSGTTTEPAVAFRLIKQHLENKYGKEEASKRIFAITDERRGALKNLADSEGYVSYVIPNDVGGRYSVLTPVGLLPIAVAGFDIQALMDGARQMREVALHSSDYEQNPCALYAAVRNILYRNGKFIEILVAYEPNLLYFIEWWKQLYGESEGKENKGIFPAGVTFTSDLHSMGQYIQEGTRTLFETVISVEQPARTLQIPDDSENLDGLNFISGKRLSEVNRMAEFGTMLAHVDGGVPNIRISIPAINENALGQLIYFFEFSCALSGYALGINPFDQPGVEAYKKNMFALLGKPGYQKETEALLKRLNQSG
ncbi:MAG: glucose-6-phosphate isomerase [Bacteroidales bacterium]|jgi:glucose-6-phosphate isomerase|nr:glucose-6-phosphate isomerase [Bacteroidales bacterium]